MLVSSKNVNVKDPVNFVINTYVSLHASIHEQLPYWKSVVNTKI